MAEQELALSADEIQEYIRNRYPLLLVDNAPRVLPGKYAYGEKYLPEDTWFFPCHFPGEPLVPGVLQLEAMFQTAALAIHTLPGNKTKKSYIARVSDVFYFMHIRPNEVMQINTTIESYRRGIAKCSGQILVGERMAAKASFRLVIEEDLVGR